MALAARQVAARGRSVAGRRAGGRSPAAVVVLAGKGRNSAQRAKSRPGGGRQQMMPDIPIDPENPQFVVFVRSTKVPTWYPLNVVTGGQAAKMLMTASENELGKKLYGNQLPKQIGAAIYRDIASIEEMAKKAIPALKSATELKYGFKVLDKDDVMASVKPSDVVEIPPEEETKGALAKAQESFQQMMSGN
mmetsp:Transcript_10323/g.35973  ORF Transcript_10323/g.35973 Transcript_10323/m.35973 type:complete len:191 (-) Transcript_10323:80-652(-)|eukprot:CAMPEP_0183788980 /NCGR_PEP_ID=MMETSP0803_2-20130417/136_1 /TAXON_ID=195967 /ORGANISM="Crustomastix stigmata, Strain CCMP3273" /LENGTH=190 /DNA_ID=CAMNT_0026033131 /DNA_START=76 /DNA_END=648 /DNA_ORIENTATION=+